MNCETRRIRTDGRGASSIFDYAIIQNCGRYDKSFLSFADFIPSGYNDAIKHARRTGSIMKIGIGSDHGGYGLKQEVIGHLRSKGHEVTDYGCHSTASCDYPQYARAVAKSVADGTNEKGIVICTTGIGVSIAANKVSGIRCALCTSVTQARLTREHNDSNVLALGAGITGQNLAMDIVDTYLSTAFSEVERHKRRIRAIEDENAPEVSA